MKGAKRCLPDCANYLQHTQRRTGLRAKGKPNSFDEKHKPSFEAPTLLADDDEYKMITWYADRTNTACYRVACICYDLAKDKSEFEVEDIVDAYNDLYRDDQDRITKTRVRTFLQKHIEKDRLLYSIPGERKNTKRYCLGRFGNRLANVLSNAREMRQEYGSDEWTAASNAGLSKSGPIKVQEEEEEDKKRKYESTPESGTTMDPGYEIGGKYQRIGL